MPAADAAGSGIGAEVLARCGIEIVQV
jgi:hypothetical protein